MTYLSDARAHLDKAREFLESARDEYDFDRFNAAASSAVISGINSKDAICLRTTGKTGKTENHNEAVRELAKSGPDGASLEVVMPPLTKATPCLPSPSRPVAGRLPIPHGCRDTE